MSQKPLKHYVTLNNKKYSYSLKQIDKESTWVECDSADIAQPFANEDIPALLIDLPYLIAAEEAYLEKNRNMVIRFRVSAKDRRVIAKKAAKKGYLTISSFLRDIALAY